MKSTQLNIIQLVQVIFRASPGAKFLSELTDWVNQSRTTQELLGSLNDYSEALSNRVFASQFVDDVINKFISTGDSISNNNKAQAVKTITEMMDAGQTREDMVYFVANAIATLSPTNTNWGALAIKTEQSRSLNALADSLVSTEVFQNSMYADALSNSAFAAQFTEQTVGDLASQANKTFAINSITALLNEGKSRGEVLALVTQFLSSTNESDSNWGAVAKNFNHKVELATLYAKTLNGVATSLDVLQRVTEDVGDSLASLTKGKTLLASEQFKGQIIDGYIKGATVFVDLNGNGKLDAGEASATTDEFGHFKFTGISGFGTIMSTGGTDIATGRSFEGLMTVSGGATVVNPLTTLVNNMVNNDVDEKNTTKEATAHVLMLFGLDPAIDILNYNPIAEAIGIETSAAASTVALTVLAANIKINNLISHLAVLFEGVRVTGDEDGAIDLLYRGLSEELEERTEPVDLTSIEFVEQIVKRAITQAGVSKEQVNEIRAQVENVAAIIINLNKAFDVAIKGNDSAKKTLVKFASIQIVAEDIEDEIEAKLKSGDKDLTETRQKTEEPNITTLTDEARKHVGDVDGDGVNDGLDEIVPVFTSDAIATAIDENTGDKQAVYKAVATDNNAVSYALKAATGDGAFFEIDSVTGVVTLIKSPDFEVKSNYSFTVLATDSQGNSREKTVSLAITNLDDTAPKITSGNTATSIDEDSGANQVIYTVTSTDNADIVNGATRYSLKTTADVSAFNINSATGAVTLIGNPAFAVKSSYNFTVIAQDTAGNVREQAVNLAIAEIVNGNVDNVAPTITSSATATAMNENSGAAQVIYTVTSTDDSTTLYSLKAGTGDVADFSIDTSTGVVTLTASPNFEAKPNYSFTVVATDSENNASEQAVSLAINNLDDTAPTITSGAIATEIDENSTAAQNIYTVTSTDNADVVSGAISYALKFGVGDAADLAINALTGVITLAANPNFERKPSYSFTVMAKDAVGNIREKAVTLAINDILDGIQLSVIESSASAGGFVINGFKSTDFSGVSVSDAGDVNGDGLADLIVGAKGRNANGHSDTGASFVVFGQTSGVAIELSAIENGANAAGFIINGISNDDFSGISVSGAGDVNGDGLADLIIGASLVDANGSDSGASYVVFGQTAGTVVELSGIEGNADVGGFVIKGVGATDFSGNSVSAAGDVNGDGLADLIIGATGDDSRGSDTGAGYVVFGQTAGTAVELSNVEMGGNPNGFIIKGDEASSEAGFTVSGAGDVNGDGLADLIVGAPSKEGVSTDDSGESFVVFGKIGGGAVELSDIEAGTGGFVIKGVDNNDKSGYSVSDAGDVNGDGLADLIVGAPFDDPRGNDSGASYVVFGKVTGVAVELSNIEQGNGGFVIRGNSAFDNSGFSVNGAGDFNGDGLDDLIIGATKDDPNGSNSGASFVVFGQTAGTAIELSAIAGSTGGFVIDGVSAFDKSGYSVSGAGDVNGDGYADLIIGALEDDPNNTSSGASFVVFGGQDSTASVGTSDADVLNGNNATNQLIAGRGDDLLTSNGGADVLRGGEGDDILVISDTNFLSLDGGTGTDTLKLDTAFHLNLRGLADSKIKSIETIDLVNDGGNSTISLDILDLINLSELSSLSIKGTGVIGALADTVNLFDDSNGHTGFWSLHGGTTGQYDFVAADMAIGLVGTVTVDANVMVNIITHNVL